MQNFVLFPEHVNVPVEVLGCALGMAQELRFLEPDGLQQVLFKLLGLQLDRQVVFAHGLKK